MSAATPVLGGIALPQVAGNGCKETYTFLGGQAEMASGNYAFDLFSTNAKRRFDLTWVALPAAEVETILAAWALLGTSTQSFHPPLGSATTVQRDGELGVNWFPSASGPRADVTLKLREL